MHSPFTRLNGVVLAQVCMLCLLNCHQSLNHFAFIYKMIQHNLCRVADPLSL